MNSNKKKFLSESKKKSFDLEHRKRINFSMRQADDAFKTGRGQFSDLETAKKEAKNIKWEAIEHLGKYLKEFETKFREHGGKVIWAENTQQALNEILHICKTRHVKTVVKSKSIVTEEIHLNPFLGRHHIDVLETDLGEFIQQLDNEPPYHIVAPAIHKSREDVAKLFHKKFGTAVDQTPEQITSTARKQLRNKFQEADAGITGINFILPDVGGIAITENEGNAWLTSSFPKIHIAITGIEKVLPSILNLSLFWPLLATHGSGQQITVYNTIFTGPRKDNEVDGPEEMYVILLDNSRTRILADIAARESLYCIRCGACLNVCPVYQNIGGHIYNTTYSGPIGAVLSPYFNRDQDFKHLSYASSLCGACTQICPVNIGLHELLLINRNNYVKKKQGSRAERWGWYLWKTISRQRLLLNIPNGPVKNLIMRVLFQKAWGMKRKLPHFPRRSFNQLWGSRQDGKDLFSSATEHA